MNFKQALIAHLQGEKVECKDVREVNNWKSFAVVYGNYALNEVAGMNGACDEFRLAPRTIMCNGVEVPAPEKEAPKKGAYYLFPSFTEGGLCDDYRWQGDSYDVALLKNGLVYLNKEDAIARAKAMLIVQEVK